MCGIIGYIGPKPKNALLLDALRRLEYRGYDSAGIAVISKEGIKVIKKKGKISSLIASITEEIEGDIGIGHTRWATHGKPSDENAHPHIDCTNSLCIVHNGIIENHLELKKRLLKRGHRFLSETDTEVIIHLIEEGVKEGKNLFSATSAALKELHGAYAICVASVKEKVLIGARFGSPLIVGLGRGENFLCSDIPAILPYTKDVIFLDETEIAVLTEDEVKVFTYEGIEVKKARIRIDWDITLAEKSGYKHFMHKEIHEQPTVVKNTMGPRVLKERLYIEEIFMDIKKINRISIVACGTSWHAALVGKIFFERNARIPTNAEIASEFRYSEPLLSKDTLVIAISQSGETADTLAAVREAKRKEVPTLAICNVLGSTLSREVDANFYTYAGPEIGVASTKAFVAQLTCLFLLSLHFAQKKGVLSSSKISEKLTHLQKVPEQLQSLLEKESQIVNYAHSLFKYNNFLYLGRGINYPIALEGALKLKEISYIHAEAYPGGEMKHGPIALIDENFPTVAIAPKDAVYQKMMSNIEEVKSRDGKVFLLATEGDKVAKRVADYIFYMPETIEELSPILSILPLQLFAYHVAVQRGCDVDQPRNLAKSVTVE